MSDKEGPGPPDRVAPRLPGVWSHLYRHGVVVSGGRMDEGLGSGRPDMRGVCDNDGADDWKLRAGVFGTVG